MGDRPLVLKISEVCALLRRYAKIRASHSHCLTLGALVVCTMPLLLKSG